MKRIAIQGSEGSFHDIAAHQFFSDEDIELICCPSFERLFEELRRDYLPSATELSMGMSGDWHIAIDEGSTLIRIGTQIFGERQY